MLSSSGSEPGGNPQQQLPALQAPLWPYLAICGGAALIVGTGSIHRWHHSDSLAPVLVSLQHWTPFLWEQDRIGMLVPLLALPFRNPLLNLVVQDVIYLFATLAGFYLLPRYLLRDASYSLVGTLSAAAFLLFAPVAWCHDFACNTFYGVWLGLGLAGLIVSEMRDEARLVGWRWLVGAVLLVLAHWVYSASIIVFGPLIVLRFVLFRGVIADVRQARREFIRHLVLVGVGFAVGYGLMCLPWDVEPTKLGTLPMREWPHTLRQLVWIQWCYLTPHHWPLFLLGAGLIGTVYLAAMFPHDSPPSASGRIRMGGMPCRAAFVLIGSAAAFILFMATREWSKINQCNWRYSHPAVFLLQAVPAILAVAPVRAWLQERGQTLSLWTAPVLLAAACLHFHGPSLSRPHRDLDRTLGLYTADVLDARCTHVAGGYWQVWPIVFHANLVLWERHDPRTIWGIAPRGQATRRFWDDLPLDRVRVAVPLNDLGEAVFYLQRHGLPPLDVIERRRTIWVLGKRKE